MTLREKFRTANLSTWINETDTVKLEIIADEFAIGFAEWISNIRTYKSKIYCLNSYEELLEMYKKQLSL